MSEDSHASDKGTQSAETSAVRRAEPISAPTKQPSTEQQLEKVEREMNVFERSTLQWTRANFVILAATCLFICFQWMEMRSGSTDTHKLADAAGKQADRTQQLVDQMKLQTGATHDLAVAGGKQADASKALADLTAKEFAASQQLIKSQRALIGVAFAHVNDPITFHDDGGLSVVFSITLKNIGRFTATRVKVRFTSYFSQFGEKIFSEPMERQRDFCDKPNLSRDSRINLKGLTNEDALIIPAGETIDWQINFGMGKPTDAETIRWPPDREMAKWPAGELHQTSRIFPIVIGCVDYLSGIMSEKHQTGFIFEVQRGNPGDPAHHTFITLGEDVRREDVIVAQYFFGQGRNY